MSSTPQSEPLSSQSLIWGVFGFLDSVLSPGEKAEAKGKPHGMGIATAEESSLRKRIAKQLNEVFRLQYWGCPLRTELGLFRLYHRNDMADALAAAYCLHKAGENPVEALAADYGLSWGGILTWEDIDEFQRRGKDGIGLQSWAPFIKFYKIGDRLVRYSLPTLIGYMLVRGDRLVWEEEALHMCVVWGNPIWEAEFASSDWAATQPSSQVSLFGRPQAGSIP